MSEITQQEVDDLIYLYKQFQAFIARTASRIWFFDLLVLVLSALTTGSLWLLLGELLPQGTLWFGASASTVTSGVTLYMKSSGLKTTRERALSTFEDLGDFLADARSAPDLTLQEYWRRYKKFETRLERLRHGGGGEDSA